MIKFSAHICRVFENIAQLEGWEIFPESGYSLKARQSKESIDVGTLLEQCTLGAPGARAMNHGVHAALPMTSQGGPTSKYSNSIKK